MKFGGDYVCSTTSFVWSLGVLLWISAVPLDGAPPEYLANAEPAPESHEHSQSVFDSFSLSYPQWEDTGTLLPKLGQHLPMLGSLCEGASLTIRPRMYYRYRDEGDGTKREAFSVGGSIDLESGWLFDSFRFGLTGYLSEGLHAPDERDGTGLLRTDQEGYAVLGQAFVDAKFSKTNARLFRQEIDLPYINRRDNRMTPNTFEGYIVTIEEVPGVKFGGGHITKMKGRDSSDFVSMSEAAGAPGSNRGLSMIGARFDLGDNGSIGLIDQYGWDTFNTFYGHADYLWSLDSISSDLDVTAEIQFTHQQSVGDKLVGDFRTQSVGGKLDIGYRSLIATFGYTTTANDTGTRNPFGGNPGFNTLMISDFDRAGEDSYRVGLSYDFSDLGLTGLSAFANYVQGETPDSGRDASPDQDEWNVTLDYRRNEGLLKNFWLRLRGGRNSRDHAPVRTEFRITANYSILF